MESRNERHSIELPLTASGRRPGIDVIPEMSRWIKFVVDREFKYLKSPSVAVVSEVTHDVAPALILSSDDPTVVARPSSLARKSLHGSPRHKYIIPSQNSIFRSFRR